MSGRVRKPTSAKQTSETTWCGSFQLKDAWFVIYLSIALATLGCLIGMGANGNYTITPAYMQSIEKYHNGSSASRLIVTTSAATAVSTYLHQLVFSVLSILAILMLLIAMFGTADNFAMRMMYDYMDVNMFKYRFVDYYKVIFMNRMVLYPIMLILLYARLGWTETALFGHLVCTGFMLAVIFWLIDAMTHNFHVTGDLMEDDGDVIIMVALSLFLPFAPVVLTIYYLGRSLSLYQISHQFSMSSAYASAADNEVFVFFVMLCVELGFTYGVAFFKSLSNWGKVCLCCSGKVDAIVNMDDHERKPINGRQAQASSASPRVGSDTMYSVLCMIQLIYLWVFVLYTLYTEFNRTTQFGYGLM